MSIGDYAEWARKDSKKARRDKIPEEIGELILMDDAAHKPRAQIAKERGYDISTICKFLNRHDRKAKLGTPKVIPQENIDMLLHFYLVERMRLEDAARSSGMCTHTARKYIRREEVKTGRWSRDFILGGVLVNAGDRFNRP